MLCLCVVQPSIALSRGGDGSWPLESDRNSLDSGVARIGMSQLKEYQLKGSQLKESQLKESQLKQLGHPNPKIPSLDVFFF